MLSLYIILWLASWDGLGVCTHDTLVNSSTATKVIVCACSNGYCACCSFLVTPKWGHLYQRHVLFFSCAQFEKAAKCYGEDPQKTQADEFFTVFSMFLNSFLEAKVDNDRFQKQREEEEKRQKLEATVSKGLSWRLMAGKGLFEGLGARSPTHCINPYGIGYSFTKPHNEAIILNCGW